MADLPFGVDRPTSDRVEVLVGKRPDRWDILQLAALSYELGACGLEVPGFIQGPALKHCGATVPMPSHAETGESLRQSRPLHRRFGPILPAVGRNQNLGDTARAGICDTGNLIKAGLLQGRSRRRLRDERFDFLQEIKLVCLAVREKLRVG